MTVSPTSVRTEPDSTMPATFAGADRSRTSSMRPVSHITNAAPITPRMFPGDVEDTTELGQQSRRADAGQYADEHRGPTEHGGGFGVDGPVTRTCHGTDAT